MNDSQLLTTLRAASEFLHRQGVGDGAAAVDEIARWVELYGDAEDWAKRAQAAHAKSERYYEALHTIAGPQDRGPWIEVYRAAGGGYEGLQAIAERALSNA